MSSSRPTSLSVLLSSLVFAVVSLSAAPTLAQGVDEFGSFGPPKDSLAGQSTQRFALELRMGPYLPNVDSEFGGNGPFTQYFGKKRRVALGLEFDWLPFVVPDVLRFGPGAAVMYTTIGGKPFYNDGKREAAESQTTSLRVFPHWVGAVLRVDALDRNTFIPLVFAAKLGFAHALWWTEDVPRNSPAHDGTRGRGRSYGYYYGLGAYLDMGFLDDVSRKRMDAFLGINRSYLFGELYSLNLDGFGASNIMDLSDRSWVLGLAFDI